MEVNQAILADLECSVCRNIMHPPIQMCKLGHSFCHNCGVRLPKCPVCRAQVGIARNYSLERVHHKLILPCKNSEDCQFQAPGNIMPEHEQFCLYSETRCLLKNVDGCKWRGLVKDFIQHCQDHHDNNVSLVSKQLFQWPEFFPTTRLRNLKQFRAIFQAHGKIFQCLWDIDFDTDFVRWYVMYVGPKEEAKNYIYTVCILNGKNQSEMIQLQDVCQAYETGLFRRGTYHKNHVEGARRLCCEEGHLNFRVSIQKLDSRDGEGFGQDGAYLVPHSCKYVDLRDPSFDDMRDRLLDLAESETEDEAS